MNDIAIKVDHASKSFKLPHEKQASVKGLFVNIFKSNRTYEKQEVLKDISFEVKKGEFFGIVGKNGNGKSTILKLLAGIYATDRGSVQINGKLTPFIELGVGFNPELTGRENVYLNGALLGYSRKEVDEIYDDIVQFAELEKFMDQKLKNYSSGMQVRLAFSIAIQAQSDILLIDEVLAVGDATFQSKCFKYFRKIKEEKRTVVFVSHDMASVQEFCDKVIVLDQGKKAFEGSAQDAVKGYLQQITKEGQKQDEPYPLDSLASRLIGDAKILGGKIESVDGRVIKKVESKDFIIRYEVEFLEEVENPNPGVIIVNEQGLQVCAANATWLNSKTGKFKKSEKVLFSFEFQNALEPGKYKIVANLFHRDAKRIHDWDNDLLTFTCKKTLQTHSLAQIPYKFSVQREENHK